MNFKKKFAKYFKKGIQVHSEDNVSFAVCMDESMAQVHSYIDKGKEFYVIQTRKVSIHEDKENKEYTHKIQVEQCIEFSAETFLLVFLAITEHLHGLDKSVKEEK